MDHYPSRAGATYYGPIFSTPKGAVIAWPDIPGPKIFAYLNASFAGFQSLCDALSRIGYPVLVHVRGGDERRLGEMETATVRLTTQVVDLDRVLRACRLVVCHGGSGTVAAALLAGKPVLIAPENAEQALQAERVAKLGAGLTELRHDSAASYQATIDRLLGDPRFLKQARKFAKAHANHRVDFQVRKIAERCDRLLRSDRQTSQQ